MTTTAAEAEERTYAKVTWRLLPFLGACYLIAVTCKDYGLRTTQSSQHGR